MKLKFNFKSFLLLVSFLAFGNLLLAQRSIKGVISDAQTKETLIGANVKVVGTTKGAVSDLDGNYSIELPAGATQLEFSYTGYANQIVTIGASNIVDITMKQGRALEDLVVVGYGTQKRKDLTGSITSITSENFVKGAIQTPEQLISGKVAGVQITSNGGRPGAGSTIRIRGGSSLNASNEPLIVIDGVPMDNAYKADGSSNISGASNPLGLINPADIESITVLKDASATAIYGVRASNGVIMIVTKRGSTGAPKFNASTNLSIGQITKKVDVLSPSEFRALIDTKGTTEQKKLLGKANTDWQDLIYRDAISHDNNFGVSGSFGKNFPYRVSLNYLNQNGILINTDMTRKAASVGFSPSLLDGSLKLELNYKYSSITNNFGDLGAIGNAVQFDPTQEAYDKENVKMGGFFEWKRADGTPNNLSQRNPLALAMLKKDASRVNRQIGNIKVDYAIPFVKDLHAVVNVGADLAAAKGDKATPAASAASFNTKGYAGEYWQNKTNKLFDFYLAYKKTLGVLKMDFTAGHSYQKFYNESRGYDLDSVPDVKNNLPVTIRRSVPDTNTLVLLGFFGRANFNLYDKYLLTATVRREATSRFSPAQRWGTFPSIALAWKLNEEGFIKNMGVFSDLKLRGSYGITGQQDAGGLYDYQAKYTNGETTASYIFGDKVIQTLRPEAYPDNKWETTYTTNVGIDYGFMNGRIFGSVDVYDRPTTGLFAEAPVPAGANLKNRIITNVGSLRNKGVEFIINYNAINDDKQNLTLGFNLTKNKNSITKLTFGESDKVTPLLVGGIAGGVGNNVQAHYVDLPKNSFYVYQQVYGTNGKPIENLVADMNGDGKIDGDDRIYYKSPDPKVMLGFNMQYSYQNFSAGFTLRSNIGNYMYNNLYAQRGVIGKFQTADGFLSNIHVNALETGFVNEKETTYKTTYYMENASFLRADNIYIAYTKALSKKFSLGVNFNVNNAFVYTKYRGLDPEIFSGIDNDFYPRARTYSLGLNLGF
jgi:TonB-dependent starch-binding outer membrane protein SusC